MTPTPWSRALTRDVDDAAIEAGWQRVRERRARPKLARAPVAVMAVVALAALLFFVLRPHSAPEARAKVFAVPAVFAETGTTLDDGSRVELAPATTLRTTATDPTHVDLALDRGRTTFDIVPGGPRAWKIDAGRVVVRVLGTRFTVDRGERTVDVHVERGRVSVEGRDVAGGMRILVAGDSIHVEEPIAPTMTPDALPSAPLPMASTTTKKLAVVAEPDFMAQADAARRDGRPRDAVALLAKVVANKDPQAALAAFTIAKIEAEDLGEPAVAATWFERAMTLGLPGGLDEEALARAIECHSKAGRRSEAARLAQRYEAKFPNGRHLERVRSWSGQ